VDGVEEIGATHMAILFLHGWQSTPDGVKPTYLKDHGHEVLNPALPDDDFDEAVRSAQAEFERHHFRRRWRMIGARNFAVSSAITR
jgi:hypothetical protein